MRGFPIHDCASTGGSHEADCQLALARGVATAQPGDFTIRQCAAWLDCGNTAVSASLLSFRGFCPDCEAVATGEVVA